MHRLTLLVFLGTSFAAVAQSAVALGGILSLTLLAAGSVLVGRKNHTMTLGV